MILAFDGVIAWLLALVSFFMSLSVAAIEGRTGNPNGHLGWWALGLFALGIVAFVGAWRTARGVRRGRLLGVLVSAAAAVAASALIWSAATEAPLNIVAAAAGVVLLLAQLAVVRALLTWQPSSPVTRRPHSGGIGVR